MKYALAKIFGWDLDYIGRLPIRIANILLECLRIEKEQAEADARLTEIRSKMRRR